MSTFRVLILNVVVGVVGTILTTTASWLGLLFALGVFTVGAGIFTGKLRFTASQAVPGVVTAFNGAVIAMAAVTGSGGTVPTPLPAASMSNTATAVGNTGTQLEPATRAAADLQPAPAPLRDKKAAQQNSEHTTHAADRDDVEQSASQRAAREVSVGPSVHDEIGTVVEPDQDGDNDRTTALEHLAAARAAMATKFGGKLDEAERHLKAVPPGSREAAEAQRLLAEIAERRAKDNRTVEIAQRRTAASFFENGLLGRGMNAHVTAVGQGSTTLRVETPLCNRLFLFQFREGAGARARELGFARLECESNSEALKVDL